MMRPAIPIEVSSPDTIIITCVTVKGECRVVYSRVNYECPHELEGYLKSVHSNQLPLGSEIWGKVTSRPTN